MRKANYFLALAFVLVVVTATAVLGLRAFLRTPNDPIATLPLLDFLSPFPIYNYVLVAQIYIRSL